jgi:hypothetical protein
MPWVKGQSGNPAGAKRRIDRLAPKLRQLGKDGDEIAKFIYALITGTVEDASPELRFEAAKWATEREWGKVPEVAEDPTEAAEMTEADLAEAERLAAAEVH